MQYEVVLEKSISLSTRGECISKGNFKVNSVGLSCNVEAKLFLNEYANHMNTGYRQTRHWRWTVLLTKVLWSPCCVPPLAIKTQAAFLAVTRRWNNEFHVDDVELEIQNSSKCINTWKDGWRFGDIRVINRITAAVTCSILTDLQQAALPWIVAWFKPHDYNNDMW